MSEFSRFRDAPLPFSDSPFRSFSSSSSIWPKETTRPARERVAASTTTTTTTVRSVSKQKDGASDEYPLSEFAQNVPVDNWFFLAKDPDFLNNIAWSAQLYINNKTRGAGYLRSKQNKKPTEQELEHPFQGFHQQGISKVQEAIRSERARPSFKPSPLLSLTKDNADTFWTPSNFLSSTTPRPSPGVQTNYNAAPVQQRPAAQVQQQFSPPAPKPTYSTTVQKQTQPYKTARPTQQQATRPWTPQKQQTKKQQYQHATSSGNIHPGPAYQVTLTSASDYQVILTRPPPPTAPTAAQKTQASSASTVSQSKAQIQPPKVISPSQLPLESHPLTKTPAKYLRPPTRAPKSTSDNQRSQQSSVTQPPVTQSPAQQQPTQQAQASEQAYQFSSTDGQLFRSTQAERITSKSVPIRPSLLLSTGTPSSSRSNPYEFEPATQKWTVEPITTSGNDYVSYHSTVSASSDGGPYRSTAPRINNYVETDVIRGRLIPTSTAQLDPFQHNGEAFSSVNDHNVQSFVVRPRSPLTLGSAL